MVYVWFQSIIGYLICFKVTLLVPYSSCFIKTLDSLTSVFETCYSPDLERADFHRQSFQYSWLNSYFFSSL